MDNPMLIVINVLLILGLSLLTLIIFIYSLVFYAQAVSKSKLTTIKSTKDAEDLVSTTILCTAGTVSLFIITGNTGYLVICVILITSLAVSAIAVFNRVKNPIPLYNNILHRVVSVLLAPITDVINTLKQAKISSINKPK